MSAQSNEIIRNDYFINCGGLSFSDTQSTLDVAYKWAEHHD